MALYAFVGEYIYDCRQTDRTLIKDVRLRLQIHIGWASLQLCVRHTTQLSLSMEWQSHYYYWLQKARSFLKGVYYFSISTVIQAIRAHTDEKFRLLIHPCCLGFRSIIDAFKKALMLEIQTNMRCVKELLVFLKENTVEQLVQRAPSCIDCTNSGQSQHECIQNQRETDAVATACLAWSKAVNPSL